MAAWRGPAPEAVRHSGLGVGDHQQCTGTREGAVQAFAQGLGVERREALVEHGELRILQQGAREEDPAALAMGQLPAGFADTLMNPARHATQEASETQFLAELLRLGNVRIACWPAATHQKIECKRSGQDMVFMELGCCRDTTVPVVTDRWPIQSIEQEKPARGRPKPGEQTCKCRFAST